MNYWSGRRRSGTGLKISVMSILSFETRKLEAGETHHGETAAKELAIVVLGGVCSVKSSRGEWQGIGQRDNGF